MKIFREDVDALGIPESDPDLNPPAYGIQSVAPSVWVEGSRIMTVDSFVTGPGTMITGSPSVFAEGKAVCRLGDQALVPLFPISPPLGFEGAGGLILFAAEAAQRTECA